MPNFIPVFRGKTRDGRWVEGQYSKMPEMKNPIIFVPREDGHHMSYEVLPETIGMSTGKTDKNGKMIFSGHIVEFEDVSGIGSGIGEVVWDDYGFCISYNGGIDCETLYNFDYWNTEIIGNTTDNSDLLSN